MPLVRGILTEWAAIREARMSPSRRRRQGSGIRHKLCMGHKKLSSCGLGRKRGKKFFFITIKLTPLGSTIARTKVNLVHESVPRNACSSSADDRHAVLCGHHAGGADEFWGSSPSHLAPRGEAFLETGSKHLLHALLDDLRRGVCGPDRP